MKRPLKYLLVILAGILVGVMAYSSYKLISDKVEHSQARSKDQDATQSYVIAFPVSPTPRAYEEHVESGVQLDDEVSPLNSMYDLDKFYAQYPDAIGWIYCPDTAVDYGLVEAEDNDYYLHRFYDGSYSVSGSLFADCNNARDFSDENTVIYGHHMNDGTKFADIMYYKEQYYYDQHPIMYISTPTSPASSATPTPRPIPSASTAIRPTRSGCSAWRTIPISSATCTCPTRTAS